MHFHQSHKNQIGIIIYLEEHRVGLEL